MSEQTPEPGSLTGSGRELSEFSEGKSITGSAQSIGLEPSENFVAPTMSLDAYQPEPDN